MEQIKKVVRDLKESRSRCLVVTCIPCNTPFPDKESPYGCANCGMLDWYAAFESEEECNRAYKKEYPNDFDKDGKFISK